MRTNAPVPLAIVAIVRDEAPYLREWIEFHRLVGVDRFFLYDNGSTDDTFAVVGPYCNAGIVQLVHWPGEAAQLDAYHHALVTWGRMARWLAFIDVDEFLFSPEGNSLPTVLKWFCGIGALGVCWAAYGTGGIASRPPGLVTESYQYRSTDKALSRHVKSVVRSARALDERPRDPHHFAVDGGAVDVRGCALEGPFARFATHELLRINHYIAKSEQEARAKMARRRADNGELRSMDLLDPTLNAVRDMAIEPWLPGLRERM